MSRLEVLQKSLEKKQAAFDNRLAAHFGDVASANGQPLNDKRCGASTMARWEKQNDALRSLNAGIELTKAAIEREENKQAYCARVREGLPAPIIELLDNGTLTQWRKHPNTFFVAGVEKGRIVWDTKKQVLAHRYAAQVPKEQFPIFRDAFNGLKASLEAATHA